VGNSGFIKLLERFRPLLIGVVWIACGILHFAAPEDAVAQIPRYLGSWRYTLSSAAGAAEIALGLLSISARWLCPLTRQWGLVDRRLELPRPGSWRISAAHLARMSGPHAVLDGRGSG
jgi:hypothetical protein